MAPRIKQDRLQLQGAGVGVNPKNVTAMDLQTTVKSYPVEEAKPAGPAPFHSCGAEFASQMFLHLASRQM